MAPQEPPLDPPLVTGCSLCPVAAIFENMVRRGSDEGLFFTFADDSFLTRDCFVQAVKEAFECAGVNSSAYSRHNFRTGAATTAARHGIPDSMIKNTRSVGEFRLYDRHPYPTGNSCLHLESASC